ncbi:MAG: ATP-binding protein [Micromonosporaceae bacterium]
MTLTAIPDLAMPFADPAAHLRAELGRLDIELARQVRRRRTAGRLAGDPAYRGLYVPEELVDALIAEPGAPDPGLAEDDIRVAAARADLAGRVAVTPPGILRLPALAAEFRLDRLDVDMLLLAISVEFGQRYATIVSWLQDDATLRRPTAGLAADLWSDPYEVRYRLRPTGPLRAGHLLELADPGAAVPASLLDRVLMAPDAVIDHLLGDSCSDPRLGACVTLAADPLPLDGLALSAAALADLKAAVDSPVTVITGVEGSGRRTAAIALASASGVPVLVFDGAGDPEALDAAVRATRLSGAALVVTGADTLAQRIGAVPLVTAVAALAERGRQVVLTGGVRWHHTADAAAGWWDVSVPEPAFAQRVQLWTAALTAAGVEVPAEEVATVADAFLLGPAQITAGAQAAARQPDPDQTVLGAAARARSAHTLSRVARHVRTPYTWADLILPTRVRRQLDEVVAAVRHRATVLEEWGFPGQRGLAMLFSGPSGTGKTMSAALIAAELGLDLYAVDLAAVVSKYIGETEKNLDSVFAEGRASNAILLFDEADALFGRRSEVKDAHDRYANLEVAYLLQRVEAYDGVTILTTNLRGNVDQAFARRLAHSVEFPAPDARLRARIWRVALPPGVPLGDDIDLALLARQMELTGSGIRNAALSAAYLAASAGEPIGMEHLVRGVGRELQKSGRVPSRAAFGAHYDSLVDVEATGAGP